MAEKPRNHDPENDPHIPPERAWETIGMEENGENTARQAAGQTPPKEELLDFLEGNPGGRPCREPLPDPDMTI